MTILLFGISNVGKTTTGEKLAKKLGYKFYDLDDEVKKYYNTTLEEFVNTGTLKERDRKRGTVIDKVMNITRDKVFSITPMSYPQYFSHYLLKEDVFAIELQDDAENIYDRLVFSDEQDRIYKDDEYRNAHKEHYISEIEEDIEWYSGQMFVGVKNKFYMNNDAPDTVVNRIINDYNFPVK